MRFAPAWLAANCLLAHGSRSAVLARRAEHGAVIKGGYEPRPDWVAFLVFGVVFTVGAVAWGLVMRVSAAGDAMSLRGMAAGGDRSGDNQMNRKGASF